MKKKIYVFWTAMGMLSFLVATPCFSKEPLLVDGNIQWDGKWLTLGHLDSEATVSPDGSAIAFVREVKAGPEGDTDPAAGQQGEVQRATEIWMINTDGSNPRPVIKRQTVAAGFAGTKSNKMVTLNLFRDLHFTKDGKKLLFLCPSSLSDTELYAGNIEDGTVKWLSNADDIEPLEGWKGIGSLFHIKHRILANVDGPKQWRTHLMDEDGGVLVE